MVIGKNAFATDGDLFESMEKEIDKEITDAKGYRDDVSVWFYFLINEDTKKRIVDKYEEAGWKVKVKSRTHTGKVDGDTHVFKETNVYLS